MTIAPLARDFSALIAAGRAEVAAEKYWADNVITINPDCGGEQANAVCGYADARSKLDGWLEQNAVHDVAVDGPFITGNHFALFIDMMITRRETGECRPFSEIAVYTVEGGKITKERYFYDQQA